MGIFDNFTLNKYNITILNPASLLFGMFQTFQHLVFIKKVFTTYLVFSMFPSDAVQEPNVTCILNNITESKTLFCSVSSQFQTTFEWTGSNAIQHTGKELHISKEEKSDSVFTCTVKNEVSQKSTSFALKDCLTGQLHAHYINCWLKYSVYDESGLRLFIVMFL